tara:strand:- start:5727 stop:6326 length:600 start_codon:yes stop_codon:yes gene_type:complete
MDKSNDKLNDKLNDNNKISDISSVLNTLKFDDRLDNNFKYASFTKKKYQKPMELTELEHRTSILNKKRRSLPSTSEEVKDILPYIDKNLEDIYKNTWNKLEKGQRLNRINIYILELLSACKLPEQKCKRLKSILHTHISNNKINKNTDVEYDSEECKINNIKGLLINVEEGTFKMTIEKSKKNKTSNKSKSNIDRFIKR